MLMILPQWNTLKIHNILCKNLYSCHSILFFISLLNKCVIFFSFKLCNCTRTIMKRNTKCDFDFQWTEFEELSESISLKQKSNKSHKFLEYIAFPVLLLFTCHICRFIKPKVLPQASGNTALIKCVVITLFSIYFFLS